MSQSPVLLLGGETTYRDADVFRQTSSAGSNSKADAGAMDIAAVPVESIKEAIDGEVVGIADCADGPVAVAMPAM